VRHTSIQARETNEEYRGAGLAHALEAFGKGGKKNEITLFILTQTILPQPVGLGKPWGGRESKPI